jgi:hypothetical protein
MISQFSVGCSRTINLGNFESLRIEATITFNVPEGAQDDNRFVVLKETAQVELRQLLEDTYRAQHVKRTERRKREPVTSHGYGEQPDRDFDNAASQ